MKARRQLKQEATHPFGKDVGNEPKILHKRLSAFEAFHMRYELADLDRVNELPLAGLPLPSLNICECRPGVKRSVDFDGVKALRVICKLLPGWEVGGIK